MGYDPLNIRHENIKKLIPDGGSVIFCPHVRKADDGNVTDGNSGGDICGLPMKRKKNQIIYYFITTFH